MNELLLDDNLFEELIKKDETHMSKQSNSAKQQDSFHNRKINKCLPISKEEKCFNDFNVKEEVAESREYKTIKDLLIDNSFELPLSVETYGDVELERYYVLHTIKDSWVYAEEFRQGKSIDYCRFNMNTKLKFRIYRGI